MGIAVLSDPEKNRIRYHTGYLVTTMVASVQLGFPRATQPMFLVEQAMNLIPDDAIGLIRERVAILDSTETRMVQAQARLAADQLGNLKIREKEILQLRGEYRYWAQTLADLLGVPLNTYSFRFRGLGGGGLNIPVQSS
jgi:hypothetical protein